MVVWRIFRQVLPQMTMPVIIDFAIKVIGTKGSTRFSHADWVRIKKQLFTLIHILHIIILFKILWVILEDCLVNGKAPYQILQMR